MKTWIFTLALLLTGLNYATSQSLSFDGLWEGTLERENGESLFVRIYIEENNVYMTTRDEDGDLVKDYSKQVMMSKGYKGQLNAFWMDSGGVWTETQFYSLSRKSDSVLSVFFTRHVSNKEGSGYTDWGYTATGNMTKQ
ncbi:hypothetical protein A9Q93_12115 [Nonlabens dokdonensis]|uniref:Uncharacterized protein n=1 Tax=Nonlabens dokdonensis TaxID=328515 RepID=A0A1Z8AL70_9FLAO|nr:hypothetical protein [Nonlabens dokdonensis]OUS11043.1 hypothetical protein A9Q93_12115 [Nonlabens dokdonensis]